jgi:hypothetical protein
MKKIPYGIADFKVIQDENYYYVDKTMFIPLLEETGKFLFFIRPRRFGKTLFLNVLESYYDLAWKKDFDHLFKETYIKAHPTQERNSYCTSYAVMKGLGITEVFAFDHHRD